MHNDTQQTSQGDETTLDTELQAMVDSAQSLSQEIDGVNVETMEGLDSIGKEAEVSIAELDAMYSDLDSLDEETNDTIDSLVIEEVEAITDDVDDLE